MSNWIGSEESTRQRFARATQINVAADGSTLLQTVINKTVQQLALREFGLQSILDRRRGQGDAEYINQRTVGTTGGTWVADTDGGVEEVGEYAQVSFGYKTLLTRGNITRKIQATGRSYADLLALEMAMKAEDFSNALENGILLGNANALGGTFDSSDCMNGFLTQIPTSQYVNSGGATNVAQSLSISNLDKAIDMVKGSSRRSDLAIVGSYAGLRAVNSALQATQQFVNETEIAAGFRVRTYDGIPLIATTSMPDNINMKADGTVIENFAGSSTALMIINRRYCYLSELTPLSVLPLAKASSQYDQFDMFWDGAAVFSNTLGGAMLTNLSV